MPVDFASVNWLAVLVAAVATFLLAGAWYQALFGRLWVRLHGYTPEQVAAMQKRIPMGLFLAGMFAAYLVLSAMVGVLIVALGITTWSGGATLGMVLFIGPALAIGFTGWLASGKPIGVGLIDWSCQAVYLVMIGAILGAWR